MLTSVVFKAIWRSRHLRSFAAMKLFCGLYSSPSDRGPSVHGNILAPCAHTLTYRTQGIALTSQQRPPQTVSEVRLRGSRV